MSKKNKLHDAAEKIRNGTFISSMYQNMEEKKQTRKRKNRPSTRFTPDPKYGLNIDQLEIREKYGDKNQIHHISEKSYLEIILSNIFTFYNMLMAAVAIILIITQGPTVIMDLGYLVILFFNVLIGTIQEIKSKNAIKKLKLLNTSKVTVIRNGKQEQVLPTDIYLDDIVMLNNGDQVPVDCIIVDDVEVDVNESLLTGESHPVKKHKGDSLFAGSFISAGYCTVLADKVGRDTYIYSIESIAKDLKKPKSKLTVSISRIIKLLGAVAIPLALLVFWNNLLNPPDAETLTKLGKTPFEYAVLYGGTTIAYMIPNGLLLIASIAMASGVIKLASKKTLTQDLYSVEALSHIDTLCLDKTGTLTDGGMMVENVQIIDTDTDIDHLMASYLKAFKTTNQTSLALMKKYEFTPTLAPGKVIEFSSDRKYSCVKFIRNSAYALGAPEYLTDDKELLETSSYYAERGLRVLLLVELADPSLEHENIVSKNNKEIALFMIRDNIRKEVKETLKWFSKNDVAIKIISGDNLKTVSYIAKQSGVIGWEKAIDMSKVSDAKLKDVVLTNTVFARVTPEQKAQIIDILKENGHSPAFIGDGVNDVIALKKADCSIALANGAAATKNIANLVLLDSDFTNMKNAVLEGRRIVNNIQRSASLFIMKDICWFFIASIPILFGLNHQIEPSAMSIVNMIITGLGSFLLAFEPDTTRLEGNFTKRILTNALISGFYMFLPVLCVYIYAFITYGLNIDAIYVAIQQLIPVISVGITISGLVVFYRLCRPFTKYRMAVFIIIIILIALMLTAVPDFYITNSTEAMNNLLNGCNSFAEIRDKFFDTIFFKFTIYKNLLYVEVGDKTIKYAPYILIGSFVLFSTILYSISYFIMSKFTKNILFNTEDKFKD